MLLFWKDFFPFRQDAFGHTSTLMFAEPRSTRVHRIALLDVTSPLATPCVNTAVAAPADAGSANRIAPATSRTMDENRDICPSLMSCIRAFPCLPPGRRAQPDC